MFTISALEIAIGAICVFGVGYYIFKGYNATGVLLAGGMALLLASIILGHNILPKNVKDTSNGFINIFEYFKYMLANRSGGLGLTIMVLCGFAAYMTQIGANNVVVKIASVPLKYIKSPYALMTMGYFIACMMSFAVTSATGLGVLLMATLYPMMVKMGVSKGAAVAVCASPAAIILSPTSSDVIVAAEKSGMHTLDFAQYIFPISLAAIIAIAITNLFWQKYCDKKEGLNTEELHIEDLKTTAPWYYFFLPFLPIAGVVLFSGKLESFPKLHIITVVLLCIFIGVVFEVIRYFDAKKVLDELSVCYKAMGEAFAGVVMLLIAAGIFAQGLTTVGFIDTLIGFASSSHAGAFGMLLVLVVITFLATVTTGSGNASFYAFVELIPNVAASMGINPAYLIVPMLQSSNLARTMSPVAGVIVATAGIAKINPLDVVKRTSVPMIVGAVVVIIGTLIFIPVVK